jgi:formylglycine-generating enzyme required for sulfatase activity
MTMVYVPSGCFLMGIELLGNYAYMGALFGTRYEKGVIASQAPEHSVCLDTYWIDQTEVTNAMYLLCVEAGACEAPLLVGSEKREDYYNNHDFADFPVTSVTRKNAAAYCEWAGGRLPTEAEWEKAARGQDRRTYPWGEEEATCDLANIHIYPSKKACVGDTVAVGSYSAGASPYGALDMAGNVAEWVGDWYATNYYVTSPEENPTGPKWGDLQVLRGGGYSHFQNNARAGARIPFMPSWGVFPYMGFRCVLPVP